VSCPDWTALTAHRSDRDGVEPAGWSAAVAHFDGGCPLCRKAALKADPTLVFRRLAQEPAAAMSEAQERAEVASVQQAVVAMRAASRLEKQGRRRGWRRWPAAAALVLLGLAVPSDHTWVHEELAGRLEVAAQTSGEEPVLEGGVDSPDARIYHMGDEEFPVVMVFDDSFDESFGG